MERKIDIVMKHKQAVEKKDCSAKKKVLVLDDDRRMVDLISEVLREIAVIGDVHGVSDIGHAMRMLEMEQYSAILSDINLNSSNGSTGIDFIKDVMSLYPDKYGNRIIVVSGDHHRIKDAIRHGACFAITKPFDVDDLRDKVSKVVME
ncbi:MAG: hypothetical protein A2219_00830 [Elusimicrobia bacterium RIFOXYA2_FULL_50_26]|nr:MAG: hypothetical protein A2219_00830 [Elusimicrobia bacterium RIFOXYA2_FULL_50_26]OGS23203.1 MAG: hypothetical protein A2314_06300 [Elusimicrobia bacterium RIFOXYB2_FULL_50_12]